MEKAPGHMPHADIGYTAPGVLHVTLSWDGTGHFMCVTCLIKSESTTTVPSAWEDYTASQAELKRHLLPSGTLVHHCDVYLSSSRVWPNPQCFTMPLCSDEQVEISKFPSFLSPNEEEISSLCSHHC